jgi:wyosine [tRNA(Phe)-imidazoG37] synthetase (radical SAM superfamily)
VENKLEEKLSEMKKNGETLDVLTFSGNGEPTMHPRFPQVIEKVICLRNKYFPEAKVSVLCNSTRVVIPAVREALMKVDNAIMKLDTVDAEYIHLLDRPTGHYDVAEVVEALKLMQGKLIIQTMFLKGCSQEGDDVDNTTDHYVLPWIETVKQIAPRLVMIYTIDRETPDPNLRKASPTELDHIVALLKASGIQATASY